MTMNSYARLSAFVLVLVTGSVWATPPPFGKTFGNAVAGIQICGKSKPPTVALDYALAAGGSDSHAVLHHFWTTGAHTLIDRMWVEYYIDGEDTPSIAFQPAVMCGVGLPDRLARNKEFAAGDLCGRSATVGGWWNTFPIPFYKSVRVTLRADPIDGDGCFLGYINVHGTVGLPLVLPGSGIPLPTPGTRLVLQHTGPAERKPLEVVPVAHLPAGVSGMIFQTTWAVETKPVGGPGAGGGYIEGCFNFYRTANESYPGLVVGTGVEDYFDSGYYFGADSGGAKTGIEFANALSGLTIFDRTGDGYERVSAYRFHTSDPLVMTDGGHLDWRVGNPPHRATDKCGTPYPSHGHTGSSTRGGEALKRVSFERLLAGRELTAVNLTTAAWVYTFAPGNAPTTVRALPGVASNFAAKLFTDGAGMNYALYALAVVLALSVGLGIGKACLHWGWTLRHQARQVC